MTAAAPGAGVLRSPVLADADKVGLLRAAASAGAQIRSVATAVRGLSRPDRPRAMVVVGACAAIDLQLVSALYVSTAGAPILAATTLPPWVGPLDLVVVLADSPDDPLAAQAAALADRRGATTVVRAAEHGPVAAAATGALLAPVVAVPEALATTARWALLCAVAASAGLGPMPDLEAAATLLDATALACSPGAETFLNSGVNIAEYLSDGLPLLISTDPPGDALAAAARRAIGALAGTPAAVLGHAEIAGQPGLLARIGQARDPFADPLDDGAAEQRIKPLLICTTAADDRSGPPGQARMALSGLARLFPGAMQIDGSVDSLPVPGSPVPGSAPSGSGAWPTSGPVTGSTEHASEFVTDDPFSARFSALLAAGLRLEFAATYLGISAGQVIPPDFPDGLGRTAGTRWAARPANVGGVFNDGEA